MKPPSVNPENGFGQSPQDYFENLTGPRRVALEAVIDADSVSVGSSGGQSISSTVSSLARSLRSSQMETRNPGNQIRQHPQNYFENQTGPRREALQAIMHNNSINTGDSSNRSLQRTPYSAPGSLSGRRSEITNNSDLSIVPRPNALTRQRHMNSLPGAFRVTGRDGEIIQLTSTRSLASNEGSEQSDLPVADEIPESSFSPPAEEVISQLVSQRISNMTIDAIDVSVIQPHPEVYKSCCVIL
jgi:hypothetical protein